MSILVNVSWVVTPCNLIDSYLMLFLRDGSHLSVTINRVVLGPESWVLGPVKMLHCLISLSDVFSVPRGIVGETVFTLQEFKSGYKFTGFLAVLSIWLCYIWLSIVKLYFNTPSRSGIFIFRCIFLSHFSSRMFIKKYHYVHTVSGGK